MTTKPRTIEQFEQDPAVQTARQRRAELQARLADAQRG